MSQRRDHLRAADVDRSYVADILKKAVDEGRLSLSEYDERLQQTYTARTYGDLDKVILDQGAEKELSGADVREALRSGGDWESLVPQGVARVLRGLDRVAV